MGQARENVHKLFKNGKQAMEHTWPHNTSKVIKWQSRGALKVKTVLKH